jgi:hypothetical protein
METYIFKHIITKFYGYRLDGSAIREPNLEIDD